MKLMDANSLINDGLSIVGEPNYVQSNAILVVGTARGGTSLVAGVLAKLGVFMGEKATAPTFEDVLLSTQFEQNTIEAYPTVQRYMTDHKRWAWKRPSVINRLEDAHILLHAPRYIFIFRDPQSIARRNNISMLSEIIPALDRALDDYKSAIHFMAKMPIFAMISSYDKAVLNPENFISEIIKFCDIDPTPSQIADAKNFITRDPPNYLDQSRITKASGKLESVGDGRVSGWARMAYTKKPAQVEIMLNDKILGKVTANEAAVSSDDSETEANRFSFEISGSISLTPNDTVRARVVNDVKDLENSPLKLTKDAFPKMAIGAIFRNEYEYILEWLAWHQLAGFRKFYICDNSSDDQTTALLEALSDLGLITLIYQPILEEQVQLVAYRRISEMAINEVESILYIDADEFLVHDSFVDGSEYRYLANLLGADNVGMVGINWRVFGSSGHKNYDPSPVLQRFTFCCDDYQNSKNGYLKSATKIAYNKYIGSHKADLFEPYKRIDISGDILTNFISFETGIPVPVENSGIVQFVASQPLRVNHYVIKSKDEYINKKSKRGHAMRGIHHHTGEAYFKHHDFSNAEFIVPQFKLAKLETQITKLKDDIENTTLTRYLRGTVDVSNPTSLQGWLVDDKGESKDLKVNIFVNGEWRARIYCGFFRPDLKKSNISKDGLSGFRYSHPHPLKPGDVVEVKVHANSFSLIKNAKVTIAQF